MKYLLNVIVIILLSNYNAFAQSQVEINFTVIVDGKLENVYNPEIYLKYKNDSIEKHKVLIVPGKLVLNQTLFDRIKNHKNKFDIILKINNQTTCYNSDYYEIPMPSNWLNNEYFIIYIYNTYIRKNKKFYIPLPGKDYNYDFYYPQGPSRVIRKKFTKEEKRCFKN